MRLGELARNNEARAIKGRSGKLGKRAGKVNVLTRGDLSSGYQSNPDRDVRLRRQGSAEAKVPPLRWEGLNIKRMSKTSSSKDERRRLNTSDRGTGVQTKWVKPMGFVQRVEQSSVRTGRKSSANISVPFLMNRRMRTRMYGGVRGGG